MVIQDPERTLPPELVRRLREQSGLNQADFAEALWVGGGKNVISSWETGRSPCSGPTAQLILLLFGGETGDILSQTFRDQVERVWSRGHQPVVGWRQVLAYPAEKYEIAPSDFGALFPDAALPPEESMYSFPYQQIEGRNVVQRGSGLWFGTLPIEDGTDPWYAWLFTRLAQFVWREHRWENDPSQLPMGNVHIGSLLTVAQQTTHFLRRAYPKIGIPPEAKISLCLELSDMAGRGVGFFDISGRFPPTMMDFEGGNSPMNRWGEDFLGTKHQCQLEEIVREPSSVAIAWVGSLIEKIEPQFTRPDILRSMMTRQKEYDSGRPRQHHELAFLD